MNAHVASRPQTSAPRFTVDGGDELEKYLAGICAQVLAGVRTIIPPNKLDGLLLGGGYGRGEGGVLKTEAGDQPYNDLEFYIFIRGNNWLNERRHRGALQKLGHEIARAVGIEIEFKIISAAKLRRSPPSMFYYDLLMGHRWLWGGEGLLAGCGHHRLAHRIPLAEAARLMMNRCSGLMFAREKLRHWPFTEADADFVGRNLAKAQLAFGDAVLAAGGQYHWSCVRRHARLRELAATEKFDWLPELLAHHAAGVEFKLRPRRARSPLASLAAQHEELSGLGLRLWLWLEGRRLGKTFSSARDYALSPLDKCPETNPWRNLLVNVNIFGPAIFFEAHAGRYPRERLFHALAILLWEKRGLDLELTARLQSELRTCASIRENLVQAYQALSARLNGSYLPAPETSNLLATGHAAVESPGFKYSHSPLR
jgi:hypothetical protein